MSGSLVVVPAFVPDSGEFFQTDRPTSLLQRFIEPEEVAAMIAFVCSPVSSATNGASLRADGGVVRSVI